MYTSFYNLAEIPFNISTDPRFLWCGEKHREALANLRFGLIEADGHVVLTGDVGTGKTTLVNALLKTLDGKVLVAGICHPTLSSLDFFNLIANAYGTAADFTSKSQFLLFIKRLLHKAHSEGKTVLLIIDEAHRLPDELFEDIWLLSNIKEEANSLLTILFVGQKELKKILQRPRHRALRQRIALFHEIEPLSERETLEYVAHRLKVAGSGDQVFSTAAIHQIHRFSLGYPRLINILCGRAMLAGYGNNQRQIDTAIVSKCIEQMQFLNPLPPSAGARQNTEISPRPQTPPPQDKGTGPEPLPEKTAGIAHQEQETAEDGLRAYTLRVSRKLLRFPPPGLTLLVLFAIAAIIGRQSFTGQSSQPNPGNKTVSSTTEEHRNEGPPQPSGQDEANKEELDKPQPPTTLKAATEAMERGNFQAAIDIMEADGGMGGKTAEQQRTIYAAALVGRAGQIAADTPEQALSLLRRAVELDPGNSRAQFQLGKIHTELKEYTSAIAAYQQALVLEPDFSDALFNLGFVYATVGMYENAEPLFVQVVQLKPDYLDRALFNLAVVQEKLGKNEQSLANAKTAAALSPENEKIRRYLQRLSAVGQESSL